MLQPLGNMKEDHGPSSLVPAKWLSFSSLLETSYHENIVGYCISVDMRAKNGLMPQICKKDIFAYNINRPML